MHVVEALHHFHLVAIDGRTTELTGCWRRGFKIGDIVLFGADDECEAGGFEADRPYRLGDTKYRGDREKRISHQDAGAVLIEGKCQCHEPQAIGQRFRSSARLVHLPERLPPLMDA